MNINERCACGASFQIDHDDVTLVAEHVKQWRKSHTCPRTTGYSGTINRPIFGFAGAGGGGGGEGAES